MTSGDIIRIGGSNPQNRVMFESDTTFIVPDNVYQIWISGCASGGVINAGEFMIRKPFNVVPGQKIPLTIGKNKNTVIGTFKTLVKGVVDYNYPNDLLGFNTGFSGATGGKGGDGGDGTHSSSSKTYGGKGGAGGVGGFGGAFGFGGNGAGGGGGSGSTGQSSNSGSSSYSNYSGGGAGGGSADGGNGLDEKGQPYVAATCPIGESIVNFNDFDTRGEKGQNGGLGTSALTGAGGKGGKGGDGAGWGAGGGGAGSSGAKGSKGKYFCNSSDIGPAGAGGDPGTGTGGMVLIEW